MESKEGNGLVRKEVVVEAVKEGQSGVWVGSGGVGGVSVAAVSEGQRK